MADRSTPIRKTPADILNDVREGHQSASSSGAASGKKYLENFLSHNHSTPNAVKFFLYDFLADDAYQCGDYPACLEAARSAIKYLDDAQTDTARAYQEHLPKIKCFERGISVLSDAMEYDEALKLCEHAVELGLGRFYQSKKASIEGMM